MTLEDLDKIEKNYKKVYEEELNKLYELYPEVKARDEMNQKVTIENNTKKGKFFFFKRKNKEKYIDLNKVNK